MDSSSTKQLRWDKIMMAFLKSKKHWSDLMEFPFDRSYDRLVMINLLQKCQNQYQTLESCAGTDGRYSSTEKTLLECLNQMVEHIRVASVRFKGHDQIESILESLTAEHYVLKDVIPDFLKDCDETDMIFLSRSYRDSHVVIGMCLMELKVKPQPKKKERCRCVIV